MNNQTIVKTQCKVCGNYFDEDVTHGERPGGDICGQVCFEKEMDEADGYSIYCANNSQLMEI